MAERTIGTALLRGWDAVALTGYVVASVVRASAGLMRALLAPHHEFTSSVLRVELRCRTGTEIGLFGVLVALSPREVCVALGTQPPTAFVYALDAPDPDELAVRMRSLETRLLRVTRGRGTLQEVGT